MSFELWQAYANNFDREDYNPQVTTKRINNQRRNEFSMQGKETKSIHLDKPFSKVGGRIARSREREIRGMYINMVRTCPWKTVFILESDILTFNALKALDAFSSP